MSPGSTNPLFQQLLIARGLTGVAQRDGFLLPQYELFKHDAFLLPDMEVAVARIAKAIERKESVVIYGDYDIDGLTATTLLLDALPALGVNVSSFIPNRFVDGYGLSARAIEQLAERGAQLIITVDCGSLSHKEIERAGELGVDVIVTDHHSVAPTMPPAVAVINPKRPDHDYPFIDLAGVGVAFKLVQALQQRLPGLADGQEKWLLDLVALGTVCDVVELKDENRANVHWGLLVMKKSRRPGIKALMAVSGVSPEQLTTRSLGFMLGPRLNAAGRLETAQLSLSLLTSDDISQALAIAQELDTMNTARRVEQQRIFEAALEQAVTFDNDNVLIVSHKDWSHGIIGIVAAKLLEYYKKPTFVLQEMGDLSKGSARSFGGFHLAEAIRACEHLVVKGGGHKLAAGVTIKTDQVMPFRQAMNEYYQSLKLGTQVQLLDPIADVTTSSIEYVNEELLHAIAALEPFGNGNEQPVFCIESMTVADRQTMGSNKQHVKFRLQDGNGKQWAVVAFNEAHRYTATPGEKVCVWAELMLNEWRGMRSVEGRLRKMINLS